MGIFDEMLKDSESLFKNELALNYEFMPKVLKYREVQQKYVAACIKPLFQQRNGKNLLVYGQPGVGKTIACRHLFKEIEEETEDVIPVYINCWQKNTTYKIILELCEQLGYKFTQNKKTEELFDVVKGILNKKAVVFAFDEIDKAEDFDFIYTLLEEVFKKTILLISNYKNWLEDLDDRIKSRLTPELLEFKPYDYKETKGILKQRMDYAFVPGVWEDDAFELIVKKTEELKDIRQGLYMMKEAAIIAENNSSRRINLEHAKEAIKKLSEFSIKKSNDLCEDERFILGLVRENSGKKIGELFKLYQEKGGNSAYKTFQRRIKKLKNNKFVTTTKIDGGSEGNTTIVKSASVKKLTDF